MRSTLFDVSVKWSHATFYTYLWHISAIERTDDRWCILGNGFTHNVATYLCAALMVGKQLHFSPYSMYTGWQRHHSVRIS